jgi:hypothetical protein
MVDNSLVEVRARGLGAGALDVIRPLARRAGYGHTNNGAVRFAVQLGAACANAAPDAPLHVILNTVSLCGPVVRPPGERFNFP